MINSDGLISFRDDRELTSACLAENFVELDLLPIVENNDRFFSLFSSFS